MSDFTAKLGMLRGCLPTVARGGNRGVRFRLGELHDLLEHRRQIDRLATKAGTDAERAGVEALLSEAGNRIEVSRRRLEARRRGIGRRRVKSAESQARRMAEAEAACLRVVRCLAESWGWRPRVEKHVESRVVAGRMTLEGDRPGTAGGTITP